MNKASTKTFFSYVIPSVLTFALSGVYTIVDGFFIGQSLGDIGIASITLAYPVSALVGAIGTGVGLSGAIRYTILNAQGEPQKPQECFAGTTLLMLLVSGLMTAILLGFTKPVMHLLGAQGETLAFASSMGASSLSAQFFSCLQRALSPLSAIWAALPLRWPL